MNTETGEMLADPPQERPRRAGTAATGPVLGRGKAARRNRGARRNGVACEVALWPARLCLPSKSNSITEANVFWVSPKWL